MQSSPCLGSPHLSARTTSSFQDSLEAALFPLLPLAFSQQYCTKAEAASHNLLMGLIPLDLTTAMTALNLFSSCFQALLYPTLKPSP